MEQDIEPYPTMLFVNEVYFQSQARGSLKTNTERKQVYDPSCEGSHNSTCVKKEECEFADSIGSHSFDDEPVVVKIEKTEEGYGLNHDLSVTVVKPEIEVEINSDYGVTNDDCHAKLSGAFDSNVFSPMMTSGEQNEASSPRSIECYEIKHERDEEAEDFSVDVTFSNGATAVNTDTSLFTSTLSSGIKQFQSLTEHSLRDHIHKLTLLCRLCGRRCLSRNQRDRNKKARPIQRFCKDIRIIYRVNVDEDVVGYHSPSVCNKCAGRITNIKRRGSQWTISRALEDERGAVKIWTHYDATLTRQQCKSCAHFHSFDAGNKRLNQQHRIILLANGDINI